MLYNDKPYMIQYRTYSDRTKIKLAIAVLEDRLWIIDPEQEGTDQQIHEHDKIDNAILILRGVLPQKWIEDNSIWKSPKFSRYVD